MTSGDSLWLHWETLPSALNHLPLPQRSQGPLLDTSGFGANIYNTEKAVLSFTDRPPNQQMEKKKVKILSVKV